MILESEFRNGHPWSCSHVGSKGPEGEDAHLLDEFEPEQQKTILQWIADNLRKTQKTPNYGHSSYGMKHLLERDTGIYISSPQRRPVKMSTRIRSSNSSPFSASKSFFSSSSSSGTTSFSTTLGMKDTAVMFSQEKPSHRM